MPYIDVCKCVCQFVLRGALAVYIWTFQKIILYHKTSFLVKYYKTFLFQLKSLYVLFVILFCILSLIWRNKLEIKKIELKIQLFLLASFNKNNN